MQPNTMFLAHQAAATGKMPPKELATVLPAESVIVLPKTGGV